MPMLMLQCKTCGEVFLGIYVPEGSNSNLLQMQILYIPVQHNTHMNTLQ